MTKKSTSRQKLLILLGLFLLLTTASRTSADDPPPAEQKLLPWHKRLAPAIDEARRRKTSILVRAGAEWCPWCRKLDEEIVKSDVQKELRGWVLVYLDIDENPDDARRVNIGPIPALRVLGASGRVVASRDGYVPADKLLNWLLEQGEQTEQDSAADVAEAAELDADAVSRLVRQLVHRDANVREAVTRRLAAAKPLAAAAVVKAFASGNLATRLAAAELLLGWQAPVQDLDPWRPDSITTARLNDLEEWAGQLDAAAPQDAAPAVHPLTAEELADARTEIARLETADAADVEAIGARLTKFGARLVAEVRERRALATSDKTRERLDWLRFRLAASDALSLKWPGGLAKLAATDAPIRRDAASELPQVVTSGDEGLLIELLSHPDPLVRELSLKALHGVGGAQANSELIRLLADPEPNVRAAVLKELAEKPTTKLVPQIANYIARETDPDLVVHAARLLREIKGQDSVDCLIKLLGHESWQVRAEAVEAIGEIVSERNRYGHSGFGGRNEAQDSLAADAYAAILEVLPDKDGFVVSRAVNALKGANMAVAAEPLAKAAEQHPELAQAAAEALTSGDVIRVKARPLLQAWLKHKDEALRAAALRSLGISNDLDGESDLIPALSDQNETVRIAAAEQILKSCERQGPASGSNLGDDSLDAEVNAENDPADAKRTGSKNDAQTLHPFENWLIKFRSGDDRPKWLSQAIEPLRAMFQSDSLAEQLAAGVPLVALGEDRDVLPVLTRIVTDQPHHVEAVSAALNWLPFEQRLRFFHVLKPLAPDAHQLAAMCKHFVLRRDTRAAGPLWELLAEKITTAELAQSVHANFMHIHNLQHYPQGRAKPVGIDMTALLNFATTGKLWQSRVALALLLQVDESESAKAGQALFDNEVASSAQRADGLVIVLLASSKKEATEAALSAMVKKDAAIGRPALSYLVMGASARPTFSDGEFRLYKRNDHVFSNDQNKNELPKELTAELVRPFLTSDQADVAAQALYLLVILGEAAELDRLIAHWRGPGAKSDEWSKLVAEAIAATDEPRQVPVLEEIYELYVARGTNVRDFYWTIRSMQSPEVLKLRKRIRASVGIDNLR